MNFHFVFPATIIAFGCLSLFSESSCSTDLKDEALLSGMTSKKRKEQPAYNNKENICPQTKKVARTPDRIDPPRQDGLENISEEKLKFLMKNIEDAYQNATREKLYAVYRQFGELSFPEDTWFVIGGKLSAEKWPSQKNWREAVGGHLFFPSSRIHQWQESEYTGYLLERGDILAGCMLAASFGHPLGLFYTAHIVWKINRFDEKLQEKLEKKIPTPISRMMERAYAELEKSIEHPDVCYALGQCYQVSPLLDQHLLKYDALELHGMGKDSKNKYELLRLRTEQILENDRPGIRELLDFAREEKYLPAYIDAARYADAGQAKEILEEAIREGYPIAWIHLGYLYKKRNDIKKYHECLVKAGAKGISYAFILHGLSLVGGDCLLVCESISGDVVEKAISCFTSAANLHDPEGFVCLADLKLALSDCPVNKEKSVSLKSEALDALCKGCSLGSDTAFTKLGVFFPKKLQELSRIYPMPSRMAGLVEKLLPERDGRE